MKTPSFQDDGSVNVPAFTLPPSQFMSAEAAGFLKMRAGRPPASTIFDAGTVAELRAANDAMLEPLLKALEQEYPVSLELATVGGIKADIITPVGHGTDPARVLINLHGGGFMMGENICGLIESIPIAVLGGYRIVSVHYRQAPEHHFPDSSVDVANVYKALLEDYDPGCIGIFGGSAGGVLTGQATAWIQREGLPRPGAIAMLGAGAERGHVGDSHYYAAYADGSFHPPRDGKPVPMPFSTYFDGEDPSDPMISPAFHPNILAQFPPALLITGTRAHDLSSAAFTHTALRKAGAEAELFVADGLGHCYMMNPFQPESRDAYKFIVDFFKRHLGSVE